MTTFKPITPEDKEVISSYIYLSPVQDSSCSFANLCCWQFLNESSYAIIDQMLVLRFRFRNNGIMYSMPIGSKVSAAPKVIEQLKKETEGPFRLLGVYPDIREKLERYFYSYFTYHKSRDHFDYIYLRKNLAELNGMSYQAKRNHVNRFKRQYKYEYVPITTELVPGCINFHDQWCEKHNCEEHESLSNEQRALRFALKNFNELGLSGGAIIIDNEIVAFTYGAPINHNTFAIHVEKANTRIHGAYAMINQEFASRIPEQYRFINREEDLGYPGLRKAKLSYYPYMLLEKCVAELTAEGL